MSSRLRSSSVGARPRKRPLGRSRAESLQPNQLEVRCACQYFQSTSLVPERINPVNTYPITFTLGKQTAPISVAAGRKENHFEKFTRNNKEEDLTGSALSFGTVTTIDYYAEVSSLSRPTSRNEVRIRNTSKPELITSQEVFQPVEPPIDFSERAMSDIAISRSTDKIKPDVLASRLQKFGEKSRSPSRSRVNMDRRLSEQPLGKATSREEMLANRLSKFSDQSRSPSRSRMNMKRQMSDQAITNDPLLSGAARAEILASRLQKFADKSRSPSRTRGFMERQMSDQILTKDPLLSSRDEILVSRLQKFADKSRSPSASRMSGYEPYKPSLKDHPLKQRSFDVSTDRERRNSESSPLDSSLKAVDRSKSELHMRLKKFPSFTERDRSKKDTKKPRGETPIADISRSGLFNLGPQSGKPLIIPQPKEFVPEPIKIPDPVILVPEKPTMKLEPPSKPQERSKTPEKSVLNAIPAITAVAASITSEKAGVKLETPKPALPPRAPTPIPMGPQLAPLRDLKPVFKPTKPERLNKNKTPPKDMPMDIDKEENVAPKSQIKSFFGRFARSRTPQGENKKEEIETPEIKKARMEAQKLNKAQLQSDKDRNLAMESMMMDHYDMPTTRSSYTPTHVNVPEETKITKPIFSSQRSLDKYSTSTLLQRYKPKSASQAPSHHGSQNDLLLQPQKMTKTVSFDYGKPLKMENGKVRSPENFNRVEDPYHRMSPMVFPVKDKPNQTERIKNIR